MNTLDTACMAKGFASPSFVNVRTGESIPFGVRHNTLSYMSAEAMAAAFGGDPSYIPSNIGFVYGQTDGMFTGGIGRMQNWDLFERELNDNDADVQIVPFSYSPSLGGEKTAGGSSSSESSYDEGDYSDIKAGGANAITFHAVSNSQDPGYRKTRAFGTDDIIYQAVLLAYHDSKWHILSRVSLYDNVQKRYLGKPDGFEVALDWTVVFR